MAHFPPPEFCRTNVMTDEFSGMAVNAHSNAFFEYYSFCCSGEEGETGSDIPLQEKFHKGILRGLRNIPDAP